MNFKNVKLIYFREIRDQLRDRRTLFMIAILPLLLYPLLGMSFMQLMQFMHKTAATVVVLGEEELAAHEWLPPLVGEERFDKSLFINHPEEMNNLKLVEDPVFVADEETKFDTPPPSPLDLAREKISTGKLEVVVYFPPGFGQRLNTAREALIQRKVNPDTAQGVELPRPQIFYNSAKEKSSVAKMRVENVLRKWRNSVTRTNLKAGKVPLEAARPFELEPLDVAKEEQRSAAIWSKILPFIVFIWALTGAFYPAVDLCAGEKERGTLETLLVSPAQRREIVWGKLLTVMTFSVLTALLNLGSMGITGHFVMSHLPGIGSLAGESALALPSLGSILCLALTLIPVSALFSALCLACAAFARSTKEGQYYLMPLLMLIMPLMMLPMSPGVELNLGNSLIPITGVVLLLRSLIEGQYMEALPFVLPVFGVMMICCLLAIRWAEEQFQSESVLFSESERLDLGRWLIHLVRDRVETPTFAQGILCSGLILILIFIMNLAVAAKIPEKPDFAFFFQTTFVLQSVCIAMPALLMALLFTSQRKKTLLVDHFPHWSLLGVGALLAVLIRPLGLLLTEGIKNLYPISEQIDLQLKASQELMMGADLWSLFFLIAILPAVCEEIAFRGFILSGLRHVGHKWWAIGLSSIAFGMVHSVLQQQIGAAVVGLVLGYLAVQTGSLLVCMIFHAIYNGSAILLSQYGKSETIAWLLKADGQFQPWVYVVSVLGSCALLWWLHRLPYKRTKEEKLQEARERSMANA